MAAKVGQVVVDFLLNTAKFESDIKKATKSFKNMGRELSDAGKTLTAGITVPLAAIGGLATKAAVDFESSFAGVRKTVNATEKEFAELSEGFREMAKEIPVNVNELNRIGEAAGQLGIETKNILGFTRVMADLGVTTNMSADQAATSLARLANITQMPQDQFDRLGSTIVALGNNFATTEAEIVEMSLRLAGAGTQIGLTEAQILGFATALSSVGIEAEAGGSALSKVFINIASEVETSGSKLALFAQVAGMSAKQFQQAFREDAAGAVQAFISGLGRIKESGGSTIQVLADLGIEEVRMRDAMLRTSNAGDLLAKALQVGSDAWRENTALSKEAAERYKTAASQLTLFKNQLQDVAIELGHALLPILRQGLEAIKPLVKWLGDLASSFAALPEPVRMTIVVIGGLAAAIGPVLMMLGSMATGAATLAPMLVKLSAGFTSLTAAVKWLGVMGTLTSGVGNLVTAFGPLPVIVASAAAAFAGWELGKWLYNNIPAVKAFGDAIGEAIVKMLEFLGLHERMPDVVEKNTAAYSRIAQELKVSTSTLDGFVKANSNAVAILGKHKAEISKLQKAVADGTLAQDQYEIALKALVTTTPKATTEQIALEKASKILGGTIIKTGGNVSGLSDEMGRLRTETEKALRPMDDLAVKIQKQISLGFSQHKIVKLYTNEILSAADRQRELGEALSDTEVDLWGAAVAMKAAQDRASAGKYVIDEYAGSWAKLDYELVKTMPALEGIKHETTTLDAAMIPLNSSIWEEARAMQEAKAQCSELGLALGSDLGSAVDRLSDNLANNLIDWRGWKDTIIGFGEDIAFSLLRSFLDGFLSPLKSALTSFGQGFGNWLSGILGGGGGGGFNPLSWLGVGGNVAGKVADMGSDFVGPTQSMLTGGGGAGFGGLTGMFSSIGKGVTSFASMLGKGIAALASNPIGWLAAGGLGAFFGGKALANWISGPNSYEAGSKEVTRDFGISMSDDQVKALFKAQGVSESQAWDIRKNLLVTPQALQAMYMLAAEQGKTGEFLSRLGSVSGQDNQKWNFATAFQTGLDTGVWDDLNAVFKDFTLATKNWAKAGLDLTKFYAVNEPALTDTSADDILAGTGGLAESAERAKSMEQYLAEIRANTARTQELAEMAAQRQTVFTFNISGDGDLVNTFKEKIVPLLKGELTGGNTGLRESVVTAYNTTSRAF